MKRVIYYILLLSILLPAAAQAQGWRGSVNGEETFSGTAARPQIANGPNLGTAAYPWLALYVRNIFATTTGCLGWGAAASQFCLDSANQVSLRNTTNAQRFNVANTFTSSTNREDFSVDWQTQANVLLIGTRTAATGTSRPLALISQSNTGSTNGTGVVLQRNAAPLISLGLVDTSNYTNFAISTPIVGNLIQIAQFTSTAASGAVAAVAVTPTYNQTTATTANTDLLINRTETMLGSGTQNLLDAQVGSVSKFTVSNVGFISKINGISTEGNGVVAIRKVGRSTAQTAAVATVAQLTTPGSDTSFEVSANVNLTASVTNTFTVTVTYTDETNASRVLTLGFTQLSGATFITAITNITGVGPYESPTYHIRCKASTTITIATTGTFTSVTYNIEGIIRQLS